MSEKNMQNSLAGPDSGLISENNEPRAYAKESGYKLLETITSDTVFGKSRAGMDFNQSYIDSQTYKPIEFIYKRTSMKLKEKGRDVHHKFATEPEDVNNTVYEAFLGEVGQQKKYEGHPLMPIEIIELIQNADSAEDVAKIIREHYKQIFSEEEVAEFMARKSPNSYSSEE